MITLAKCVRVASGGSKDIFFGNSHIMADIQEERKVVIAAFVSCFELVMMRFMIFCKKHPPGAGQLRPVAFSRLVYHVMIRYQVSRSS